MRNLLIPTLLLSSMVMAQNGAGSAGAGQGGPGAGGGEASAEVQDPGTPAASEAAVKRWVGQLGGDSYRDRLHAEEQLREAGEAARAELQRVADDDGDREAQWRARKLLRELDRKAKQAPVLPRQGAGGGLVERGEARRSDGDAPDMRARRGMGGPHVEHMRREFDRIFRRMEEDFGLDVPRHRFFGDSFFQDLRRQLQDAGGRGSTQGMSMQVGPDGVRVEVMEPGPDGGLEPHVYEAPDLETFREKYPDVLGEGGGLMFDFGLPGLPERAEREPVRAPQPGLPGLRPRSGQADVGPRELRRPRGAAVQPSAPAEGERLGVTVGEIPSAVRAYLELDPGQGLMVQSVQDDSLARALGLEPRDIVVAINGSEIGSPADVRKALAAIGKGETVAVEYLRRGRRLDAKTEKRHDAPAADASQRTEIR